MPSQSHRKKTVLKEELIHRIRHHNILLVTEHGLTVQERLTCLIVLSFGWLQSGVWGFGEVGISVKNY